MQVSISQLSLTVHVHGHLTRSLGDDDKKAVTTYIESMSRAYAAARKLKQGQ